MAAIIVAAIAVSASLLTGDRSTEDAGAGDSAATVGSISGRPATDLTIAPAPGVEQPSEGTWEELLPRLEQAADASPGDVNLQRKLALAYYNLGRYDEAAAIYERLLAAGEDAVLRSRLGNTLRDMGDVAGAEDAYRRAIEDDATLPAAYLDLAELLWRQGRDGEALTVLDEGLAAVPEDSRATLEQGRMAIEAGHQ